MFCLRISSLHAECDTLRRRLEEATEKLRKQEEIAMRSEVGLNFYQLTFISFLHRVQQGLVVRRIDNAIHWINLYPVESVECIVNTYPPDSDLSGGYRYPTLKQLALVLNLILPLLSGGIMAEWLGRRVLG